MEERISSLEQRVQLLEQQLGNAASGYSKWVCYFL